MTKSLTSMGYKIYLDERQDLPDEDQGKNIKVPRILIACERRRYNSEHPDHPDEIGPCDIAHRLPGTFSYLLRLSERHVVKKNDSLFLTTPEGYATDLILEDLRLLRAYPLDKDRQVYSRAVAITLFHYAKLPFEEQLCNKRCRLSVKDKKVLIYSLEDEPVVTRPPRTKARIVRHNITIPPEAYE